MVREVLKILEADGADCKASTGRWRTSLPRLTCGYPAVAVVLAAHFLIAAASVQDKSNTCDEIGHITAGYSY